MSRRYRQVFLAYLASAEIDGTRRGTHECRPVSGDDHVRDQATQPIQGRASLRHVGLEEVRQQLWPSGACEGVACHQRVPGQEYATVGQVQRTVTRGVTRGVHHDRPTGKVQSTVREVLQCAQPLHLRGFESQHVVEPHDDARSPGPA